MIKLFSSMAGVGSCVLVTLFRHTNSDELTDSVHLFSAPTVTSGYH